jgi:hypothetical protein
MQHLVRPMPWVCRVAQGRRAQRSIAGLGEAGRRLRWAAAFVRGRRIDGCGWQVDGKGSDYHKRGSRERHQASSNEVEGRSDLPDAPLPRGMPYDTMAAVHNAIFQVLARSRDAAYQIEEGRCAIRAYSRNQAAFNTRPRPHTLEKLASGSGNSFRPMGRLSAASNAVGHDHWASRIKGNVTKKSRG